MSQRLFFLVCMPILAVLSVEQSKADDLLRVVGDGVVVYSGPSLKYRPIAMARKGQTFPVSAKQYESKGGEFYLILIKTKRGKKRAGYVLSSKAVEVVYGDDGDSLSDYQSKSFYSSSIHMGVAGMPDTNVLWTVGYQSYIGVGLYWGIFGGELLNETTGSTIGAVELGSDQGVFFDVSISTYFALGAIVAPIPDLLFLGSNQFNYYAHGGFGIRYDADEYSAVQLKIFQIAFINNNNSYLSLAIGLTLEVGL